MAQGSERVSHSSVFSPCWRNALKPLLNLTDLARLLGRSPATLKRDLRRNPAAVPPQVRVPGTRLLRWREEDVTTWLENFADAKRGHHG